VSIVEGQKRISVIVDRTFSKAAEVVGQVAKADREIVAASVNLFYSLDYFVFIEPIVYFRVVVGGLSIGPIASFRLLNIHGNGFALRKCTYSKKLI
jgi:hypothetical protein